MTPTGVAGTHGQRLRTYSHAANSALNGRDQYG